MKDQWGLDLASVEVELTLADVTPAMEALRPLAADSLRAGLAAAARLGAAAAQAQLGSNAA